MRTSLRISWPVSKKVKYKTYNCLFSTDRLLVGGLVFLYAQSNGLTSSPPDSLAAQQGYADAQEVLHRLYYGNRKDDVIKPLVDYWRKKAARSDI